MKCLISLLFIPNILFTEMIPLFLDHEINTSEFLSFLNKAKMENQQYLIQYSDDKDRSKFMFHLGKDIAYADIMEYFRDD